MSLAGGSEVEGGGLFLALGTGEVGKGDARLAEGGQPARRNGLARPPRIGPRHALRILGVVQGGVAIREGYLVVAIAYQGIRLGVEDTRRGTGGALDSVRGQRRGGGNSDETWIILAQASG